MGFFDAIFSPDVASLERNKNVAGLIKALAHKQSAIREEAAVALGNLRNDQAINALTIALTDNYSAVRLKAAQALRYFTNSKIGTALPLVDKILNDYQEGLKLEKKRETDSRRENINKLLEALKHLNYSQTQDSFKTILNSFDQLVEIGTPDDLNVLYDSIGTILKSQYYGHIDYRDERFAVLLGKVKDIRSVIILIEFLIKGADSFNRYRGYAEVVGRLKNGLRTMDYTGESRTSQINRFDKLNKLAAQALVSIGELSIEPLVKTLLKQESQYERSIVIGPLIALKWQPRSAEENICKLISSYQIAETAAYGEQAVAPLQQILSKEYKEPNLQISAIKTLRKIGTISAIEAIKAATSESLYVKEAFLETMGFRFNSERERWIGELGEISQKAVEETFLPRIIKQFYKT
jgi:HEAT repeat protein